MSNMVSDYLIQRISEWGVRRIFGSPGDSINGITGVIDRAGDKADSASSGMIRGALKEASETISL